MARLQGVELAGEQWAIQRLRARHTTDVADWYFLGVGVVPIGTTASEAFSHATLPTIATASTGQIMIGATSARVPIGTDLFPSGIAYLESRDFREPSNNGPFMVYEFRDSQAPSFWYYKDSSIVPIGSLPTGNAQSEVTIVIGTTER